MQSATSRSSDPADLEAVFADNADTPRSVRASDTIRANLRAAVVAVAPVVVLAGFAYHPYVTIATDEAAVAAAAASNTTRWGAAHLAIGVGYALVVLAFVAVRSYLRDAGEDRWSVRALPLIVLGATLFPILTGMEFALVAAAETGGDVEGAQAELVPWFLPVLFAAAVCYALGAFGFAVGIARSRLLPRRLTRLVVGGLVVSAVARFVPLGATQIAIGVAMTLALWPLAYTMWKRPVPAA